MVMSNFCRQGLRLASANVDEAIEQDGGDDDQAGYGHLVERAEAEQVTSALRLSTSTAKSHHRKL